MLIRAAVLRHPKGRLEVETLELADPKIGEVRVKIVAAGICHSDWHLVTGDTEHPMPVVLGHEGAGVIDAVGPGVNHLKVGDHVALNWAPSCGRCFYCQAGQPNLCSTFTGPIWAGTMLDGTTRLTCGGNPVHHYCGLACFADFTVVPVQSCVPVPADLPFDIAAVLGCAATTGVGSVLNTAQVKPGATVVIFGAGGVGLSAVMGAKLAGAKLIIASDPISERRIAALEVGATHSFSSSPLLLESVQKFTDGRGADYVIEAAGIPEIQELCLKVVRPGGTVVFSGLAPMGTSTNLPGAILVRQEKTVKGSYYGSANPPVDFLKYAAFYKDGKLPLDRLISKTYPLDSINDAFHDMLTGATRRGIIKFSHRI